jgi:hypothetical protein
MGTRGAWVRAAVAGTVVAGAGLGGGACSPGGGPPQRGFGSVQLVAIRDPTLQEVGQWSENQFAYSLAGNAGGLASYFFLDVTTGQVTSVGSKLPPFDDGTKPNPIQCEINLGDSGDASDTITDTRTGQTTVLANASSVWPTPCPSPDNPNLFVWTKDGAGHLSLSQGLYTALMPVPIDVLVSRVVTFDADTSVFTVLAAEPGAPYALGLYRVDPAVGASVPVVAPALGDAAWAAGAAPTTAGGALASSTLALNPTARPVGDHFIYPRTMSDGSTVLFAGPLADSPIEVALFAPDDSLQALPLPYATPSSGFARAWATSSGAGAAGSTPSPGVAEDTIRAWYPSRRQLVTCSVSPADQLVVDWQPAPDRLIVGASTVSDGSSLTAPLLSLSAGDTPCTLLADKGAYDVWLSTDDASLTWLAAPTPFGDRELWTAGVDGSAPRKLGTGDIQWQGFISNRQVELALGSDLVWLTLDDDPTRLHYVAEGVYGHIASQIGSGPWLLTGYDYSVQDSTGTVGLVDLDTGQKKAISGSVAWYWQLSGGAPDATRIVYLVRGRNPSPQDGIWMATVTTDELP